VNRSHISVRNSVASPRGCPKKVAATLLPLLVALGLFSRLFFACRYFFL
jgi:hypothetical protein